MLNEEMGVVNKEMDMVNKKIGVVNEEMCMVSKSTRRWVW